MEACHVNTLVRWILLGDVCDAEAMKSAAFLADRAHAVVQGGVTAKDVGEHWGKSAKPKGGR